MWIENPECNNSRNQDEPTIICSVENATMSRYVEDWNETSSDDDVISISSIDN